MSSYMTWIFAALALFAILANFGTYNIYPLGTPIWTVLGVVGGYGFAHQRHKRR